MEGGRREEPSVSLSVMRFPVGHVGPGKGKWWSIKRNETFLRVPG